MTDEIWRWDAVTVARAIKLGQVSCREAVESCLGRLDAVNRKVNSVTLVLAEQARAAADEADRRTKQGSMLGALHGVPVTIKDNVDQAGVPTTNSVAAFRDLIAESDSPPVANLRRAGAIVIGRTNTPSFSLRWHTENELYGATLNPWEKARTPGGSSGGAAVSVAVGIAPLAHGNDYGGSLRYPAYCCGVAAIRPTFGRVPAFNGTATAERPMTFQLCSVQGAIARRIGDLRLALGALAVGDVRDPWWVPAPLSGPELARPIRVALTVDPAGLGVAPAVAQAVRRAGAALEQAGYVVEEVEPPAIADIASLFVRLGWNDMRHMLAPLMRELGDGGINRVMDRRFSVTPETDLVTYMRDLSRRAGHLRDWMLFLERYPVVVGPVSTELPFPAGFDVDPSGDMAEQLRAQRLLIAVPLLGLPAVTVPVPSGDGMPLGVQVIASRYREDVCLDAAEAIEQHGAGATPIDVRW